MEDKPLGNKEMINKSEDLSEIAGYVYQGSEAEEVALTRIVELGLAPDRASAEEKLKIEVQKHVDDAMFLDKDLYDKWPYHRTD